MEWTKRIKFRFIGLSKVDWNDYDFHITPVLTFTNVNIYGGKGKSLALEWGHWALYIGFMTLTPTSKL